MSNIRHIFLKTKSTEVLYIKESCENFCFYFDVQKKLTTFNKIKTKTMIRKFKHKNTGIVGINDPKSDYFLHFERGDDEVVAKEAISMEFIEGSNDWEEIKERKPTEWFETKQIETWIGLTDNGGRAKLIVLHQCGEYEDALIGQLKTMIHNIETNGEDFAS